VSAKTRLQHVVITGASSGLGAALARAYAKPGVALTLSGRNEARLANVTADCAAAGAEASFVTCDVTDAGAMAAWLDATDRARAVDIVFANAGIGGIAAMAPTQGETSTTAGEIIATNMLGVVNTATAILPRFLERRRGHLVVISSLAGQIGLPHCPAYCGSKAAATAYAQGLRRLMRPHGVQVTVVNPGFVDTPMARSLPEPRPHMWSAEKAARLIKAGVTRGKSEITFPWYLRLAIAAARLVPNALLDAVLAKAYVASLPSAVTRERS
jgi:short-subunit dehydrogenase